MPTTRCLFEWQLLTLILPPEASTTAWAEMRKWLISAKRIKTKRDHIVPLLDLALEILEIMHHISDKREHVFPQS